MILNQWRIACRRFAWRYPEWWTLAFSLLAWLVIVAWPHAPAAGMSHHSAHTMTTATGSGDAAAWAAELLRWMIMVVAMMFPLVLDPVRTTAARSLWPRRHRAIAGFLAGYLARWLILGALASIIVVAARGRSWFTPAGFAAAGFALALVWQFVPWKRRGLRTCHRTMPIAPRGWRADRDCLHYGWTIGGGCLLSCWALMAACLLAGHGMAAMACTGAVAMAERYRPRPDQRMICGGISAFALAYAVVAFR